MPQKIYFGSAIVKDIKTRQTQTINGVVFKESDKTNDNHLRNRVLRKFKPQDRPQLQVIKLCFDTAKFMGLTVY